MGAASSSGLCGSPSDSADELLPGEIDELWIDDLTPTVSCSAGGWQRDSKGGHCSGFCVHMPRLIYGTAWKEKRIGPGATADLTAKALRSGFRAVDTACQPKHYHEPGVGEGLHCVLQEGMVTRDELYIQSKFSRNQDDSTIPYDKWSSIEDQVHQSVTVSLKNLGIEYLDCLVMHSPYPSHSDTMRAWAAMESEVQSGRVRQLGISNLKSLAQLQKLYADAIIKPALVQQRFHAKTRWERRMRLWCRDNGLQFQSFWTLKSSNKAVIYGRTGDEQSRSHETHEGETSHQVLDSLAKKYGVSNEVLYFRFCLGLGICPVIGTSSVEHMQQDLAAFTIPLSLDDAKHLDSLLVAAQQ